MEGPLGLQEALIISRRSAREGCEFVCSRVSIGPTTPQQIPTISHLAPVPLHLNRYPLLVISVRFTIAPEPQWPQGNRISDLPTWSALLHPTAQSIGMECGGYTPRILDICANRVTAVISYSGHLYWGKEMQ
jgi:hypothetical protein